MSNVICRKFRIDAGHRVYGHEGKCASLHGHSYEFWVYVKGRLDPLGRVIDYGVIKHEVGNWLEQTWDHAMILWEKDPIAPLWTGEEALETPGEAVGILENHKHFLLAFNPTAENLAQHLLAVSSSLLRDYKLEVDRVVCWETPNCFAEARWEDE